VVLFKLLFGEELARVNGEKKPEQVKGKESVKNDKPKGSGEQATAVQNTATLPGAGHRSEPSKESVKHSAQAPQPTAEGPNDDEESSYSATAAVTALSNTIMAAFAAMGLRNDTSSSSGSEAPSRDTSPKPSDKALQKEVGNMDDATVEKFLQSRQGNVG
jgi:hypothetical protein